MRAARDLPRGNWQSKLDITASQAAGFQLQSDRDRRVRHQLCGNCRSSAHRAHRPTDAIDPGNSNASTNRRADPRRGRLNLWQTKTNSRTTGNAPTNRSAANPSCFEPDIDVTITFADCYCAVEPADPNGNSSAGQPDIHGHIRPSRSDRHTETSRNCRSRANSDCHTDSRTNRNIGASRPNTPAHSRTHQPANPVRSAR